MVGVCMWVLIIHPEIGPVLFVAEQFVKHIMSSPASDWWHAALVFFFLTFDCGRKEQFVHFTTPIALNCSSAMDITVCKRAQQHQQQQQNAPQRKRQRNGYVIEFYNFMAYAHARHERTVSECFGSIEMQCRTIWRRTGTGHGYHDDECGSGRFY